jgi:hypothetical protein
VNDEVIKCMMPITTNYAELDEGLYILEQSIEAGFGARPRQRYEKRRNAHNGNAMRANGKRHGRA